MPEDTVSGSVLESIEETTEGTEELETEEISESESVPEETPAEGSVSGNTVSGSEIPVVDTSALESMVADLQNSNAELRSMYDAAAAAEQETETVYDNLQEFISQPVPVNRYEYELLSRLEFMQYGIVILIALLFLILFKRK